MGTIERGPSKITKNSSKCDLTLGFDHITSCFQDLQVKAQAEMDAVAGQELSPTWADIDEGRLPYLTALVKEETRFSNLH